MKDVGFRLNCGDHIIKNIIDYIMFEKISPENRIRDRIKSCRRLVTYAKQSNVQYQLPLGCGLKNEVKTRWNATLTMLNSIHKALATNVLFDLLEEKGRTELITDIDTELLSEVVNLLELFQEATLYFEPKHRATIHYVALYRIKLENHLKANATDVPEIVQMKYHGLVYMRPSGNWMIFIKKQYFFTRN